MTKNIVIYQLPIFIIFVTLTVRTVGFKSERNLHQGYSNDQIFDDSEIQDESFSNMNYAKRSGTCGSMEEFVKCQTLMNGQVENLLQQMTEDNVEATCGEMHMATTNAESCIHSVAVNNDNCASYEETFKSGIQHNNNIKLLQPSCG